MGLSYDLISQFAKVVNSDKKQKSETTIYGTVVDQHGHKPGDTDSDGNTIVIDEEGGKYVKPDGSDQLIPISDSEEDPAKANMATNATYGDRASVLIKDHTATVTGNISSPSAGTKDIENKITEFDIAVGEQIQANKAYFKDLTADKANLGNLVAAIISVAELIAKDADIENLIADKATVTDLIAKKIDADVVEAGYVKAGELDAIDAKIGTLDTEIADINTLMFGSATGNVLQTTFANAVIALLGDAQIKSAMIESLNASQITAGRINTDNVIISPHSGGHLLIQGNTIQIVDENKTVRVQIGKDASKDYSINVWDAYGKLMFSEGGITDAAIKDAIIRDDMVSDEANINAKKLDIESLFTEINDSTETIKSTKVYFDSQQQTLDVAFKEMNTTVEEQGETIKSQGTNISVLQGEIKTRVTQQELNTATNEQNTKYSALEQDVNGFKAEVRSTYSTKEDIDKLGLSGRNLLRNSDREVTSYPTNSNRAEFVPYADIAPIFDKYGLVEYTLSFDIKSADTSNKDTVLVYCINSETSKHYIGNNYIPVTTEYTRHSITFTPYVGDETQTESRLCFYGTFGTGNIPFVKNVKIEKGNEATEWCLAPEDTATHNSLNDATNDINQTIKEHVSAITNNADALSLSVSTLEASTNDKLDDLKNSVATLRKDVELKVSNESVDIKIQNALNDGTKKVDTGTGIKFDIDGMTVNKIDSDGNRVGETNTQITENGMTVNSNITGKPVLEANKDGVVAANLHAKDYLIVGKQSGRSRFEDYGNNRTACFWIGE